MDGNTSGAVLDILSDVLEVPVEDLRDEPRLTEHGWDSMSTLEVMTMVESRFGTRFDLRSFSAVTTPDEIVAMVEEK